MVPTSRRGGSISKLLKLTLVLTDGKFLGLLIRDAEWEREWDCPKGSRLAEDLEMIEVFFKPPSMFSKIP